MKIVIPFVANKLKPETRAMGEALDATFEDLTGDEFGYFKLVAKLFAKGASFLLVEEDIVATPELLAEMWDCQHEWCHAFAFRYIGAVAPGESRPQLPRRERETALFCHKVAGRLLEKMGTTMPRGPFRWQSLDFFLLGWLAQNAQPHLHGPVTHLHQQHPDWAATIDWTRVEAAT